MRLYMKYSTKIYSIYLKFLAPEDIFVYQKEIYNSIIEIKNIGENIKNETLAHIREYALQKGDDIAKQFNISILTNFRHYFSDNIPSLIVHFS